MKTPHLGLAALLCHLLTACTCEKVCLLQSQARKKGPPTSAGPSTLESRELASHDSVSRQQTWYEVDHLLAALLRPTPRIPEKTVIEEERGVANGSAWGNVSVFARKENTSTLDPYHQWENSSSRAPHHQDHQMAATRWREVSHMLATVLRALHVTNKRSDAAHNSTTGRNASDPKEQEDGGTNSTVGKNASELAPHKQWATKGTAHKEPGFSWQAVSILCIVVLVLFLLALDVFAPHVVMMAAFVFAWNLNIITTPVAISNFANPALVTLGALFIVVKGVDKSKLIDSLARQCLGERSSQQVALLRFCSIVVVAGGFISATPLVALLMPIIRDWARSRDFAPSKFLIPLSYSAVMGGSLTIIGSTTNLMVQGLLQEASGESFSFFENAGAGGPAIVCSLVFLLTLGRRLLPDNHGGMFRTLKERSDMITELQVPEDLNLVGTDIRQALEQLGIQPEALLKVFRKPARKLESRKPTLPRRPSYQERRVRFQEKGDFKRPSLYEDRTAGHWGSSRKRAATDGEAWPGGPRLEADNLFSLADPSVREIFPVPDNEVLEGGDLLVLSLPTAKCIALSRAVRDVRQPSPPRTARLRPPRLLPPQIPSPSPAPAPVPVALEAAAQDALQQRQEQERGEQGPSTLVAAPKVSSAPPSPGGRGQPSTPPSGASSEEMPSRKLTTGPLQFRGADILMLPGYQNEYVELVVSNVNPFVGQDLRGSSRRKFEKHYQVGLLAVRHATGQDIIQLLTELGSGGSSPGARQAAADKHLVQGGLKADSSEDLRAGDTVLVLAETTAYERLLSSRDFLAATRVGLGEEVLATAYDYIPLLLFVAGLVLTAVGGASLLRVSMALAVIYIVGGWVPAEEVRECIDWNLLMLVGCSLGLAEAVKASGLSSKFAAVITGSGASKRSVVWLLFIFVMLISECVTSAAAAALGFPLALDLTEQLDVQSLKPLAMTVMLGASTSYANPVATPPNLIVMGPGGYGFLDFMKVGIFVDLTFCVVCCSLVPMVWPLD